MHKGLIVKITKEYAVVLSEENLYCKIIVKDGMSVGQKIFFLEEDLLSGKANQERRLIAFPYFGQKVVSFSVMAACLVFFLFVGIIGIPAEQAWSAVVSVDINPSIEMKVNRDKQVKAVNILNPEGYEVAGQYLIGLKIEEAVTTIVEKAVESGYLAADETVLLAVSVNSTEVETTEEYSWGLIEQLTGSELPEGYSYLCLTTDREDYFQAQEHDLSLGKYEILKMAKDKLKPEEVKAMKVKDLLENTRVQFELKEKNLTKQIWLENKRNDSEGKPDKKEDLEDSGKNKKDKNNNKEDQDHNKNQKDKVSGKDVEDNAEKNLNKDKDMKLNKDEQDEIPAGSSLNTRDDKNGNYPGANNAENNSQDNKPVVEQSDKAGNGNSKNGNSSESEGNSNSKEGNSSESAPESGNSAHRK